MALWEELLWLLWEELLWLELLCGMFCWIWANAAWAPERLPEERACESCWNGLCPWDHGVWLAEVVGLRLMLLDIVSSLK
jgi:hypothetical protein